MEELSISGIAKITQEYYRNTIKTNSISAGISEALQLFDHTIQSEYGFKYVNNIIYCNIDAIKKHIYELNTYFKFLQEIEGSICNKREVLDTRTEFLLWNILMLDNILGYIQSKYITMIGNGDVVDIENLRADVGCIIDNGQRLYGIYTSKYLETLKKYNPNQNPEDIYKSSLN